MKKILLNAAFVLVAAAGAMTANAKLPEIPQGQLDELNALTPIVIDEQTQITKFFPDYANALSARVEVDVEGPQVKAIADLIGANRAQIRRSVCPSPLGQLLAQKYGIFKFKYYSQSGEYMKAVIFNC